MTTTDLDRRQARWAIRLARYDFEIIYHKGKENPADGLSRRPNYIAAVEKLGNPLRKVLAERMGCVGPRYINHIHEPGDAILAGPSVGILTRSEAAVSRVPEPWSTLTI